jgi:hypothetical protein
MDATAPQLLHFMELVLVCSILKSKPFVFLADF